MITQHITLSADRRITPPVLYAVQNDTGRVLKAGFCDYVIPAGSSASFKWRLPTGEESEAAATISGQTVSGSLTAALAKAGKVSMQVEIDDGKTVTSFALLIIVQPDMSEA